MEAPYKQYSNEEKLKYFQEILVYHQQMIGQLQYRIDKHRSRAVAAQKRIAQLQEELAKSK